MAREARKLSSKGLYYVELKGDRLFFDDEDRERFLELIEKYFKDGGKIYGYVLNDDRIYMAVKESSKGISLTMKPVTVSYARYFNKRHGGDGSIFTDRFKSIPYESLKELKEAAEDLENVRGTDKKERKKATKKSAPKKTVDTAKNVTEKVTPPTSADEKKPEMPKKRNRNLPSWLL